MSQWTNFLPLVVLALLFWLLIVRPMRKRQRDIKDTQQAISIGSKIMLASGIYGQIATINDETIELQVAPQTTLTVHRQAIARVVPPESPAPEEIEGN